MGGGSTSPDFISEVTSATAKYHNMGMGEMVRDGVDTRVRDTEEIISVGDNTRVGEDIKGGMARVIEDNDMLPLTEDVKEEDDGAADSTTAGWDGMQLGHVLFPPKTLSEEVHPGCADSGVKSCWVTDYNEFNDSRLRAG